MGVYDEDWSKFQVESRASLEADQERELSRRFRESVDGMNAQSVPLEDYDAPVLGGFAHEPGTLSPQHIKQFRQSIGYHDASTGENLLGKQDVQVPEEDKSAWGQARRYLQDQAEAAFDFGLDAAIQTVGIADDVRNNILNTTADIAVALGLQEEDVVRGEQNIPYSQNTALAVGRDLAAYGAQYVTSRAALLKTIGQPATLMQRFGLESAAGAVADFMSDPRTDSLIDFAASISGQERVISEMYKDHPMLARGALSAEGAAIGVGVEAVAGMLRGGMRAIERLSFYADDLEQIGVDRMRRSSSQLNSGIDPEGMRGMVEWMTARIMKGADVLTDGLRMELAATGANGAQIDEAFTQAKEVVAQAEKRAEEQIEAGMRQMLDEGFEPIVDPVFPVSPKIQSQTYGFQNTSAGLAQEALDTVPGLTPEVREFLQGKVTPPTMSSTPNLSPNVQARVRELDEMLRSKDYKQRELAETMIVDEFGGMGSFQSKASGLPGESQ